MNETEIRDLLSAGLENCEIEMQIDGNRLVLRLVGDVFCNLSRVKRSQRVYSLLNDKINAGEIHAVSMSCLTRDESGL